MDASDPKASERARERPEDLLAELVGRMQRLQESVDALAERSQALEEATQSLAEAVSQAGGAA